MKRSHFTISSWPNPAWTIPAWTIAAMLMTALLIPASAQETDKEAPKETTPPASAETPVAPPKEPATEDSDVPPDLGENVSADNNVSFPVDI